MPFQICASRYVFHVCKSGRMHANATTKAMGSLEDAMQYALDLANDLEAEASAESSDWFVVVTDDEGEEIARVILGEAAKQGSASQSGLH